MARPCVDHRVRGGAVAVAWGRAEARAAMAPFLDPSQLDDAMATALRTLQDEPIAALARRFADEGRAIDALERCRAYARSYGFWWRVLPAVACRLTDDER